MESAGLKAWTVFLQTKRKKIYAHMRSICYFINMREIRLFLIEFFSTLLILLKSRGNFTSSP